MEEKIWLPTFCPSLIRNTNMSTGAKKSSLCLALTNSHRADCRRQQGTSGPRSAQHLCSTDRGVCHCLFPSLFKLVLSHVWLRDQRLSCRPRKNMAPFWKNLCIWVSQPPNVMELLPERGHGKRQGKHRKTRSCPQLTDMPTVGQGMGGRTKGLQTFLKSHSLEDIYPDTASHHQVLPQSPHRMLSIQHSGAMALFRVASGQSRSETRYTNSTRKHFTSLSLSKHKPYAHDWFPRDKNSAWDLANTINGRIKGFSRHAQLKSLPTSLEESFGCSSLKRVGKKMTQSVNL